MATGARSSLHEAVFTEQNHHGSLEALRAVRTERYQLVLRLDPVGPRLGQGTPERAFFEEIGFYDRATGTEELYDLYLDPKEACNREADPALAAVKARRICSAI